jgi:ABC-type transport system involved in multi-copper enzyme maturation permease subunit
VIAAPLLAYSKWHVREALPRMVTPLALFVVLGGLPLWALLGQVGADAVAVVGSEEYRSAMQVYGGMLSLSITLGAIVVASGIIALDRERQYFRFLFSHPVAPWQFYLQKYVITALLFSAAMMLIPLGFSALVVDVSVTGALLSALVYALLYGSLAMLCGALLNKDGVVFIGVVVVTSVLQESAAMLPSWLVQLAKALPPLRVANSLRSSLLGGTPVDAGDVLLVAAYSLGMLIAALVIVRRAPLAR